jgi:hypothetical protein
MRSLLSKAGFIIWLMLILLVAVNAANSETDGQAKVIYVKGNVKIQRAGDDFWILAKRGMVVNDQDKIKTFIASEVEIALDSTLKNIVKIEPDTQITLEEIKEKKLYMPKGKVFSLIEALPPDATFEIMTPTAVAGVRGTGISVDCDGKKTDVKCFEDKAYVKGINLDGSVMDEILFIEPGNKRIIHQYKIPGELIILTAYEREEWFEFRERLKEHIDFLRDKRSEGSRGAALELHRIGRMRERFEGTEDGVVPEDGVEDILP